MGVWLFIFSLIFMNLSRYFNINGVTWLLNRSRTTNKIGKIPKFIMWFSGFRGAMAYALSMKSSEQFTEDNLGRIMLTLTLLHANINV